ncbi:hypothetical protein [Halobacillus naozhouensis]|uniref:Phage portal protein, SPP1 Gp6-like n=1 Tax=Halobacillus naozhouensis TaxID=554880 RepID=A0ABY8J155_9BACI|nr:hypothetical protein [Halobacillus naozhouensis]WFT76233.1 hypothetical protein P9989_07685 [Halobacillus naozhouensis]
MTINWTKWNNDIIEKSHGKVYFFRDLYEGEHSKIFTRAQDLIRKGEIIDNIVEGARKAQNVQTPYITANISKLIPEIPAMLVSRSIGSINSTQENEEKANQETEDEIDNPESADIIDPQQQMIEQIEKNSTLQFEHWSNIVQQQVDGGLVGVPWKDEVGIRIDFKQRDVYFPHEDGLGADLAYEREFDEEKFLHIYRERVEDGDLIASNILYMLEAGDRLEEVDEEWAKELLGMDELETVYNGRTRPFIMYWPNEKTFTNPLGVSCLKGQEGKQDEINWTLTRNAITFERNGKPRLAVSKEIFQALQDKAHERYGDESKIDHRDLEITTLDENGNAMEVIQIDITKIGDIQWIKDLMKMMFVETKTSEKAVDFYMDEGGRAAQTGVAKFYDLFISIVKAEQLQGEYIYFLQQLFESCLWLANEDDRSIIVEEPEITIKSMIPISRKELIEENNKGYVDGAQSLETTVRRNNPHASDDWIQEEVTRIEEEKAADDTASLVGGRSSLMSFMDNRDSSGNPIEDDPDEQ